MIVDILEFNLQRDNVVSDKFHRAHDSGELPCYTTLTLAEIVTHRGCNDEVDGSGGRQRCGECPLEENEWVEVIFRVRETHRNMVEFCVCVYRVSEVGTRQN